MDDDWLKGKDVNDLDYMASIDSPENITPDRLRFMRYSMISTGSKYEAKVLGWCADLIEQQEHKIDAYEYGVLDVAGSLEQNYYPNRLNAAQELRNLIGKIK